MNFQLQVLFIRFIISGEILYKFNRLQYRSIFNSENGIVHESIILVNGKTKW